ASLARLDARRATAAGVGREVSATSTNTSPCGVSGNVASTLNDSDNSGTLTVGDSVTVVYNACHDSATSSVSGSITASVTSISDTGFVATASLDNVQATDQGVSSSVSGRFTLSETDTSLQSDEVLTIGSTGLAMSVQSTAYADTITFSDGMRLETLYDNGNGDTSLRMDGGLTSSKLGGALTLTTVQPVVQHASDAYPSSGQVRAVGAANSTLLMTVLNAVQVQLQLDADGNGSYESTTTTDWSTLIGQQG
ncbi:MAG TPA: hypothetical protein VF457_18220, partial [Burkholderiaceae bacterium]